VLFLVMAGGTCLAATYLATMLRGRLGPVPTTGAPEAVLAAGAEA